MRSEVSQAVKASYSMYPLNTYYLHSMVEIEILDGIKAVKIVMNAEDSVEWWAEEKGRI